LPADGGGNTTRLGCNYFHGPFAGQAKENFMLYYALVFLIIAIIAGVLGFSGLAAGAAGIAKILFIVFLVIALATFVVNMLGR
jgi:uncharacterized membrane protein YtjA (UPF0391 family)